MNGEKIAGGEKKVLFWEEKSKVWNRVKSLLRVKEDEPLSNFECIEVVEMMHDEKGDRCVVVFNDSELITGLKNKKEQLIGYGTGKVIDSHKVVKNATIIVGPNLVVTQIEGIKEDGSQLLPRIRVYYDPNDSEVVSAVFGITR